MASKVRLDQLLVETGRAASRDEARRLILAGAVLVDETVTDKPGAKVDPERPLRVNAPACPYAGRGGLKLEGALRRFEFRVRGLTAADLGASTGGFTDCLLQHGAARVFAIDVGRGQLAHKLQTDPRVTVMDRTNCRHLTAEDLGGPVDLVVADLSFIGLKTVFPAIERIARDGGLLIALIKPQFEIGKGRVGKRGLVKNPDDHAEVLLDLARFAEGRGWGVAGLCPSPIAGKTGNREFLILARKRAGDRAPLPEEAVRAAVREAHGTGGPSAVSETGGPPLY